MVLLQKRRRPNPTSKSAIGDTHITQLTFILAATTIRVYQYQMGVWWYCIAPCQYQTAMMEP